MEWQLEEDHCLSQAVKKFPVFLTFNKMMDRLVIETVG